jgi:proton-coupled amino acid transporter
VQGIGVVLPIEDKMKTPAAFSGYFGIINLGMTVATCLYASVGFYGYLRFGDTVHDTVTLDLPCRSW